MGACTVSRQVSVSRTVSTRPEAMSTTLALATGRAHHRISIHPSKWQSQQPSPSSTSAGPHLHLPPSSQPLTMAATLSSVAAPSLPKHGSIIRAQQQAPPSIISASTTVSRDRVRSCCRWFVPCDR